MVRFIKYFGILFKTIIFNFKVFPFKTAIKLPILISYKVKTDGLYKNCIEINSDISRFMIKININKPSIGVNCSTTEDGYLGISQGGKIIFTGKANFATGVSIRIDGGKLKIGNGFNSNGNCHFSCGDNVEIGNDVLLGWNVNIRTTDGHTIYNLENPKIKTNENKPIIIGDHVWIASNVDILKNVEIPENCVIGYRSCVTRKFTEKNCIIGGYPAKIIKRGINWEY